MSNLLKSSYVVKKDETRIIDSNGLIASRLQDLEKMAAAEPEAEEEAESAEFKEGLNARQLEMLFDDNPDRQSIVEEMPENDNEVDEAYLAELNEQAVKEAEEIVKSAKDEAEAIVEAANTQAESIREENRRQGYSEGFEQGREEGLKIIDEKKLELEEKEAALQAEYEKKIEEAEPMLVDAITDIYEHIFHVSLSSNREIMLNLLHDTVRNIEGGKNFIIHVSKSDYEYINDRKDQLTEGLGSTDTIEVIEDLTLRQSEAFIEAEGGIYDCGIGTELELLKKELMLISYQKN